MSRTKRALATHDFELAVAARVPLLACQAVRVPLKTLIGELTVAHLRCHLVVLRLLRGRATRSKPTARQIVWRCRTAPTALPRADNLDAERVGP